MRPTQIPKDYQIMLAVMKASNADRRGSEYNERPVISDILEAALSTGRITYPEYYRLHVFTEKLAF